MAIEEQGANEAVRMYADGVIAERYPEADREDRDTGSTQVATLGVPGRSYQLDTFRLLLDRQRGPQDGRAQLHIVDADGGLYVLVFDEILVRTTDYQREQPQPFHQVTIQQLLAGVELASAEPALDGRVTRLRFANLGITELQDLARELRGAGYQASMNHVTPLGPVLKSNGGPGTSARTVPFPPPWAPKGAHEIIVAVIDTGVTAEERADEWLVTIPRPDAAHPDLDNIDPLDVFPFGNPDQFLDLGAGHGTFVAGVIQQLAPSATIDVYRAINSDGIGSEVAVAEMMLRAVADGATILNLSLGSETLDDQPPLALEVALELIDEQNPDVLVVAAAGNSGTDRATWPAAFNRVVSVAALDPDLRPADWSNHGWWVTCSAVGQGILSTYVKGDESPILVAPEAPDHFPDDSWAIWSGTSFAAPQICGAVAAICQQTGLSPRRIMRQLLLKNPVTIPDYGKAFSLLPGA